MSIATKDLHKQIKPLIQSSALSQEDKQTFVDFLVNFSDEKIAKMIQVFKTDHDQVFAYWATLNAKIIVL